MFIVLAVPVTFFRRTILLPFDVTDEAINVAFESDVAFQYTCVQINLESGCLLLSLLFKHVSFPRI